MSYLRPVLRDGPFGEADGGGWGFLEKHVFQNDRLFGELLEDRRRKAAYERERTAQNVRMHARLGDSLRRDTLRKEKKLAQRL